jgi:hypothetical protein
MTTRIRTALVALALAVVAVLAAVLGVPFGGNDQPDRPAVVTQPLAAAAIADPAQPNTIQVPAADLERAEAALDDHQGSRSERPPDVPPAELAAGAEQRALFAKRDRLPRTAPLAAPQQAGCRSQFVRNYSSRNGVRPRLWVVHYTVSPNRAGWGDVDAITSWFTNPASQASSHYIVDDEAHCAYVVRESDKAWTQSTHNPWSLSMEIIATGREGRLTSPAGLRRIGQVISDSAERWDIPLRRGAVSGCTVTRSGIVDHAQLGSCGGGHSDIRPYALQPVIDAAIAWRRASTTPTGYRLLVKGERTQVDELLARRRIAHRHGGWSRVDELHLARASKARAWIRQRLRTITDGSSANRPQRRAYLRLVEATPSMRQP